MLVLWGEIILIRGSGMPGLAHVSDQPEVASESICLQCLTVMMLASLAYALIPRRYVRVPPLGSMYKRDEADQL